MDQQEKKKRILAKYLDTTSSNKMKPSLYQQQQGNISLRDDDQILAHSSQQSESQSEQSEKIQKRKRIQSSEDQQDEDKILQKARRKKFKEEAKKQKQQKKDRKIKKKLRKAFGLSKGEDIDQFLQGLQIQGINRQEILAHFKQNKSAQVKLQASKDEKKKKKKVKKQQKDSQKLKYQMFQKQSSSDLQIPQQARTIYRNKDGSIREQSQKLEKEKKKQEIINRLAQWQKGMKKVDSDEEQFAKNNYDEDIIMAKKNKIWDDPMKRWQGNNTVKLMTCKYEGAANRFGIKPGFRWDGVIRGNGFQNKLIQQKNLKKAQKQRQHRQYMKNL